MHYEFPFNREFGPHDHAYILFNQKMDPTGYISVDITKEWDIGSENGLMSGSIQSSVGQRPNIVEPARETHGVHEVIRYILE